MDKLNEQQMETVAGGRIRQKYVSAFYCEYCRETIHLSGVYSLERAKKEHDAKYHPELLTDFSHR